MKNELHDDMFLPEVTIDPYSYFGKLRDLDPVHWNSKYEAWVITNYEDISHIMRNPDLFSSAFWKDDPKGPFPPIQPDDKDLYSFVTSIISKWVSQVDPPNHTRIRQAIQPYFTSNAVERWRPRVNEVINQLLKNIEGSNHMDAMEDFARPLPVLIISSFMGISTRDATTVPKLANSLTMMFQTEKTRMKGLAQGMNDLVNEMEKEIRKREFSPTDDLLSIMVRAYQEHIYSREELVANAIFILFAGHETTINLICNGILAFINNPEQWKKLKSNPGLASKATEECLRYEAPVKRFQRLLTRDTEMRGKKLIKGDRVFAVLSSANRDPQKFVHPDIFDITRHPNPHISFGGGVHHCLGVSLARMEAQEAFSALVRKLSRLKLANPNLEYHPSFNIRSLKSLPISWI